MPRLLVIDTSASVCKVGLASDDCWQELETNTPRQAAQEVLGLIEQLLVAHSLSLTSLDGIAIAVGPGSFTGLRIGIGIVQGLGEAAKLPVIPVSNLALLGYSSLKNYSHETALVCLLAREDEVYLGHYGRSVTMGVELLGQERVMTQEALTSYANNLKDEDRIARVGDGWLFDVGLQASAVVNLSDLGELAAAYLAAGNWVRPEQLLPNYVKEDLDYLV